ncbi:CapA family protein [Nocardioides sp. R-C-SC26]|uniref:CapA family protein n=1 Tax=Nocardioides sp. R-C-SC26 TaxID=2870414 RepID=UPI001E5A5C80|nr:CapA family protein [Nocardioides sp. R-C-SC26]
MRNRGPLGLGLVAAALVAAATVGGPADQVVHDVAVLVDEIAAPTATGDAGADSADGTAAGRAEIGGADRAPRRMSLVMGGDLLWHNTVWQSAQVDATRTGRGYEGFDFDPMFAGLRSLVARADVALCHEEVPFARPGQALQSYPVFAAPRQVAPWLADFGFDACTTASNHAVDQGWEGLRYTATLLRRHGVMPIGTFRSAAERRRPVILATDDDVRVGVVAGTYSLNGFLMPEGRPWAVSLWDADNLLTQARAARAAGADIVVVHLHGGDEYQHLPNADQVSLVRRLTRSPDVDLVLGDHAHVVQPVTRVNGTWVVYGMGNMVAQQEPSRPATYQGISVRFEFTERDPSRGGGFAVTRAAYIPTTWNLYGGSANPIRIVRINRALRAGWPDAAMRARLLAARAAIRDAVDGLGRAPGLREG